MHPPQILSVERQSWHRVKKSVAVWMFCSVKIMVEKLDPEQLGIITLSAFMEEFYPNHNPDNVTLSFSLLHYNGLQRSCPNNKVTKQPTLSLCVSLSLSLIHSLTHCCTTTRPCPNNKVTTNPVTLSLSLNNKVTTNQLTLSLIHSFSHSLLHYNGLTQSCPNPVTLSLSLSLSLDLSHLHSLALSLTHLSQELPAKLLASSVDSD